MTKFAAANYSVMLSTQFSKHTSINYAVQSYVQVDKVAVKRHAICDTRTELHQTILQSGDLEKSQNVCLWLAHYLPKMYRACVHGFRPTHIHLQLDISTLYLLTTLSSQVSCLSRFDQNSIMSVVAGYSIV